LSLSLNIERVTTAIFRINDPQLYPDGAILSVTPANFGFEFFRRSLIAFRETHRERTLLFKCITYYKNKEIR